MSCSFCYNAYVWAKEPKIEEDCFSRGLDDDNDWSSSTIGSSDKHHQLYFNSGNGKPCNIEVCKWGQDNMWHTVGIYYPKFCPECGRPLDEYLIDERGTSFKRKTVKEEY